MIEREREEAIIHNLRQNAFTTVHEIIKFTEFSEATIQRNFTRLEKEGCIQRFCGGAEL